MFPLTSLLLALSDLTHKQKVGYSAPFLGTLLWLSNACIALSSSSQSTTHSHPHLHLLEFPILHLLAKEK